MQSWIKLWKFLDDNDDITSIQDISNRSSISYPSVLDALRMFEDVGYINIVMSTNKKTIVKTQKWVETRDNLNSLYEYIQRKESVDEKTK